jgi:hypothetical protein
MGKRGSDRPHIPFAIPALFRKPRLEVPPSAQARNARHAESLAVRRYANARVLEPA